MGIVGELWGDFQGPTRRRTPPRGVPQTPAANEKAPTRGAFHGFSQAAMARLTGLEPATPGVTGRYSNQLSYNRPLPGASNEAPWSRDLGRSGRGVKRFRHGGDVFSGQPPEAGPRPWADRRRRGRRESREDGREKSDLPVEYRPIRASPHSKRPARRAPPSVLRPTTFPPASCCEKNLTQFKPISAIEAQAETMPQKNRKNASSQLAPNTFF